VKYFGINLNRERYKHKKLKCHERKVKHIQLNEKISYADIGRINVKMPVLSKVIYQFNTILSKFQ
jgi:hypothetical protein